MLGEYEYKLDDKGRVSIPPRFRSEFKDGIVLTPGVEKCIVAYSLAEWKKVSATITTATFAPSKLRRLNRAFFATAFSTFLDGQGRVALPYSLRHYAEIESELVIIGANTYLEMWNKDLWISEKTISQEQAWQIIESLERR